MSTALILTRMARMMRTCIVLRTICMKITGQRINQISTPMSKQNLFYCIKCKNYKARHFYIISEETSVFAPQRIPLYKDPRVAACTVGKVRSSTVFMCVCSTFRSSDFLLFVKNGFVVGVRCQGNREPPADGATTPLSQRHSWLGSP